MIQQNWKSHYWVCLVIQQRNIVTSYDPYACVTVFERMNRSGPDLTVFISSGESRRPPRVSVLQSHCQHHHCEHHQGTQSQSHGHRGNIRYEQTPVKPHWRILNITLYVMVSWWNMALALVPTGHTVYVFTLNVFLQSIC